MTVGFAVQELAAAAILAQRSGDEVAKITKSQIGHLVLTIRHIQLHVVEDATKSHRLTAVHPMKDGRTFILVLKDSGVGEVRRRSNLHGVAVIVRYKCLVWG